ncbi:hypothetical protein WA026_013399 [Henosepilachna vigintioctopunctata]|uniref:HTH OST-type domain-containing protein n=1 Tax=Henosepilachna vigintioctopunctata TaxID=420089 RepID=A0AAW1VBS0_9CUCU
MDESEKAAHLNYLVIKKKKEKIQNVFDLLQRPKFPGGNFPTWKQAPRGSEDFESATSTIFQNEYKAELSSQNEFSYPKRSKTNYEANLSPNISLLLERQHPLYKTPNNYKNMSEDIHFSRIFNYKAYNFSGCDKDIQTLNIKTDKNKQSLQKYSFQNFPQILNSQYLSDEVSNFSGKKKSSIESEKVVCRPEVPKQVQDDLKKLIEVFPKGLWCEELVCAYKRKYGRALTFRKFGYSSVIDMCEDLKSIFYCGKESECHFKVYDVRKQVRKITKDNQVYFRNGPSYALPLLDRKFDTQLFPKDAVGRGVEIKRDFVSRSEVESDIFRVVVAEIYDPSKFWLFRDDGKLDALMDEIQSFYSTNKERYRIPEQFLEIGLYCAAVVLKKFQRCVIVQMIPDFFFVHVFCIDYGSLGIVPRNEVCFLTNDFARLPAQAIRARLANICPPIEFAMWTSEARDRFKKLADMKHLEASITKVSREKKIIEVYVENPVVAPGRDIGSILVDEEYAVYDIQFRSMNIHHSNCTPPDKFLHLIPDFEEIENWNAPSIEEMAWFSNKDLKNVGMKYLTTIRNMQDV